MLRAHGVTERGRVRPTNEDCFGILPHLQLCIVADGLGGHNAGEVAARIAVDTIADYIERASVTTTWPFGYDGSLSEGGNLLRTAIHIANIRVLETAVVSHEYSGMGTTIVAALVRDAMLSVAHVGDSRLYLRSHAGLLQLTDDDSWAAAMAVHADGGRAPMNHPMRHVLTNVVGTRPKTTVHVMEAAISEGDVIALTTDGVHGVLDERLIDEAMRNASDVAAMAQELVHAALSSGSRDNCTAVVARYCA